MFSIAKQEEDQSHHAAMERFSSGIALQEAAQVVPETESNQETRTALRRKENSFLLQSANQIFLCFRFCSISPKPRKNKVLITTPSTIAIFEIISTEKYAQRKR